MAARDYTYTSPLTTLEVSDGKIAYADDVNRVWQETDSSLAKITTDMADTDAKAGLADKWSAEERGVLPDTGVPDTYSAKAYADEAGEWASSVDGTIELADGTDIVEKSAKTYAGEASSDAAICAVAQPICADAQVSCEEDRILAENAATSALASSGITYLAVDWTATAGQTVFDTVTEYTAGIECVYLNGRKLVRTTDFTTSAHAITLVEAADLGDSVQFITGNHAFQSGLELLEEGGQTGWRLVGTPVDNYGNIGNAAINLSISNELSTVNGATGTFSFCTGVSTIAKNMYSQGHGAYNLGAAPDTVYELGIGWSDATRKNALEIYTDGTVTTPEASLTDIDSRGATALVTNEFVSRGGSTASRPSGPRIGSMYFDWDLSKPVWYNGAAWVDATGVVV